MKIYIGLTEDAHIEVDEDNLDALLARLRELANRSKEIIETVLDIQKPSTESFVEKVRSLPTDNSLRDLKKHTDRILGAMYFLEKMGSKSNKVDDIKDIIISQKSPLPKNFYDLLKSLKSADMVERLKEKDGSIRWYLTFKGEEYIYLKLTEGGGNG